MICGLSNYQLLADHPLFQLPITVIYNIKYLQLSIHLSNVECVVVKHEAVTHELVRALASNFLKKFKYKKAKLNNLIIHFI